MKLITQKRLASEILGKGIKKIRIDPAQLEEVSKAITRDDVRHFIATGAIKALKDKGNSRGRFNEKKAQKVKGRRKGHGKRTGHKNARTPKREKWINKVRALRDELKKLQAEKKISEADYRKTYRRIKGNLYNSRRHMREQLNIKQ
jgi:large subunit ribosomal protein L19e